MIHGAPVGGGVATVVESLTAGLRQSGCHVSHSSSSPAEWKTLLAAVRQSNVMLATHNFRPAYVAWALGVLLRKPVVVWFHGPLSEVLAQAGTSRSKRQWLRWLYRRAIHLVFVSHSSKRSFDLFMEGLPMQRESEAVIVNALLPRPETAPPSPRDDGTVHVGYVGRLSPEKNPHLLIEMMRSLPARFRLTLLGDGPLRGELEDASYDLAQAGRIRFLGYQQDSAAFYATQDLTVLTSLYEGCPMAMLESLQAGVPCVGVPIPSLQEMTQEHAPYLLAKDNTASALADAVFATLNYPSEQRTLDLQQILIGYRHADFVLRWHQLLVNAAAC
ncbi:MAG: glycosyltransferase [Comamonadaceae bacterium]|nr:MAG: glycosyltransferase [Comamonadaceae bacterium]